ncbi:MAG: hypothetical protein ACOYMS_03815 [Terrimicrobiaceae bacterium]
MTTAELSAATGVSPITIRRLAKELGAKRAGRVYVFPKDAPQRLRGMLKNAPGQKPSSRKKGSPGWRTVRVRFQKKKPVKPPRIRIAAKKPGQAG